MRARLLLLLGGLAIALLLAEGGVRLLDRYRCLMGFSGDFWEPQVLYGWRHTPGAFGWAKRCFGTHVEWETFTRINSRGLRDRDIPYERTGAFRVLVLGDSYAEGMQIPVEETFEKLLERRLAEAGDGRPVEVVNAGCSGYGTDNSLLFYRHEGRKYRPDLVLLAFNTGNDIMENYTPLMREVGFPYGRKPYFLLDGPRLVLHDFPLPSPPRWLAAREALKRTCWRHSALYRFVVTLVLPRVVPAARAAGAPPATASMLDVLLKKTPPVWNEAWRVTRALVRRLRHDVERDHARLVVVVFTSPWEVSAERFSATLFFQSRPGTEAQYDMGRASRTMVGALERAHIAHLSLLEPFRAHLQATGVSGYFEFDQHWNAAGHALAAEVIARGLREQGLVPHGP
jgi:hypothetical protein